MCLYGASEMSVSREFESNAAEAWARAALTDSQNIVGRTGTANASNAIRPATSAA
jgi:hypothetical protein